MNQRTRDSVDEEAQITDVAVPRKTVDPDETIDDRLTDNVLNRIGPARYFQRDENGDPVETWHDVFDRVASNIADAEYEFGGDEALRNEWKGKFETAMREQRFIPNTPTISSAGTELQMLSACFVLSPGDSMEDILDTVKAWGLVEADGGGMGGAFYRLRPKGALVSSTGGTSSGPMPFIEMYDAAGGSIKQGSIRSGAQMAIMHAHHADVGRFIVSKRTEGDLDNFNISVAVTDEFIDAVRNDESYTFYTCDSLGPSDTQEPQEVLPETAHFYDPEFEDAWNEERNTPGVGLDGKVVEENLWRDYDIEGIEQYRDQIDLEVGEPLELPARFIWSMMMDGAWKNGEPGVYHIDEANREHTFDVGEHPENFQYATNPSLVAGTKVQTDSGAIPIQDLEDESFEVPTTDGSWASAKCFKSGENETVYEIELSNGRSYKATAEHEWPVDTGTGVTIQNERYEKVRTDALESGDRLPVSDEPSIPSHGTQGSYDDGLLVGFLYGDGSVTDRSDVGRGTQYGFTFSNEDAESGVMAEILRILESVTDVSYNPTERVRDGEPWFEVHSNNDMLESHLSDLGVGHKSDGLPAEAFEDWSADMISGFIDGLFSADSYIDSGGRIVLTSAYKQLVHDVQDLLGLCGVSGSLRREETDWSDDDRYSSDTYDRYDLKYSRAASTSFRNLFTLTHDNKQAVLDAIDDVVRETASQSHVRIKSVTECKEKFDVWDITVYDSTHTFRLPLCFTGNCAEQMLTEGEACNLGHVNLSLMVDENAPQFDAFASRDGISGDTERVVNAYLNRALNHEQFEDTIKTGTRFLDNVVTQSEFPLDEISEQVENKRKIGLGLMGFAQMLVQMGIPYGSDESYVVAREIMRRIDKTATEYSHELAKVRGPFPDWDDSKWADPSEHADWFRKHGHSDPSDVDSNGYLMRNHSQTTIAPTGTTSRVANTTGGCEPIYNTIFFKNVSEDIQGDEMLVVMDDFLERVLEANDIDPDYVEDEAVRLMKDDSFDTISDVDVVPESIDDLFTTTEELSLREHIEMQVEFQKHCSSGISKTGNAPFDATRDDISDALLYGLENGVKGTTVYRQGSRKKQVNTTSLTNKEFDDDEIEELVEDAQLLASIQPDDAESLVETIEDELDNGGEN